MLSVAHGVVKFFPGRIYILASVRTPPSPLPPSKSTRPSGLRDPPPSPHTACIINDSHQEPNTHQIFIRQSTPNSLSTDSLLKGSKMCSIGQFYSEFALDGMSIVLQSYVESIIHLYSTICFLKSRLTFEAFDCIKQLNILPSGHFPSSQR